jgi:hypothetical protein
MTSSSSARRRQGRRLTPLWTSARHTAVWRAVELILRTARGSDGLTIIAIGPLTNLAAALVADPALAGRLAQVVVMGGAFEVPGNVTPAAEFNFFMDPEAAQIVLESGVRPVLVGLDVCNQTHLTSRQIAATGFTTELGQFVQRSCAAWLPPMEAFDDEGPHLYDTLAVASVFRPGLLTLEAALSRSRRRATRWRVPASPGYRAGRRRGRARTPATTRSWPPASTSAASRRCSASACSHRSEMDARIASDECRQRRGRCDWSRGPLSH